MSDLFLLERKIVFTGRLNSLVHTDAVLPIVPPRSLTALIEYSGKAVLRYLSSFPTIRISLRAAKIEKDKEN
jgi:hypothetical protein